MFSLGGWDACSLQIFSLDFRSEDETILISTTIKRTVMRGKDWLSGSR